MPGYIDIQIIGDQRGVDAMLAKVNFAISPVGLSTFMKAHVEPWLQGRAQERFTNEGDDAVGGWAPLEPATQLIRGQRYGAEHPINRRTGELENYITQTPADVAQIGVGVVLTYPGTKTSGELTKKVETAQVGRAQPRTVPRPVLGMNETDLAAVLGGLARFIQGLP